MFKTISKMKARGERGFTPHFCKSEGFTLIELLIVVAIIGILAAIAIPGYIGMQERGRKGGVIRAAAAAESDLQAWLSSSLKTGAGADLVECDTDWDGVIDATKDKKNSELAGKVATTYVTARAADKSPWIAGTNLWNYVATLDATAGTCETAGRITVSGTGSQICIEACDNAATPNVIHRKIISAD